MNEWLTVYMCVLKHDIMLFIVFWSFFLLHVTGRLILFFFSSKCSFVVVVFSVVFVGVFSGVKTLNHMLNLELKLQDCSFSQAAAETSWKNIYMYKIVISHSYFSAFFCFKF